MSREAVLSQRLRSSQPDSADLPVTDGSQSEATAAEGSSARGSAWLRVYWMAFGNLILAAAAMLVLQTPGSPLTIVGYWVAVALLAVARTLDVTRHHGATAEGEPATREHLRSYLTWLAVMSVGLFGLAYGLGQVW